MTDAPIDPFTAVAPLSTTLHRLDEAHRRFRNYVAVSLALSPTELTALLVIAITPGISPSALAADLTVTHGAVTVLIDRLEDAGLTEKVPNPVRPQVRELALTVAGQQTLTKMRTAYRVVLGEADTDGNLTRILPQLDNITAALNLAAARCYPGMT